MKTSLFILPVFLFVFSAATAQGTFTSEISHSGSNSYHVWFNYIYLEDDSYIALQHSHISPYHSYLTRVSGCHKVMWSKKFISYHASHNRKTLIKSADGHLYLAATYSADLLHSYWLISRITREGEIEWTKKITPPKQFGGEINLYPANDSGCIVVIHGDTFDRSNPTHSGNNIIITTLKADGSVSSNNIYTNIGPFVNGSTLFQRPNNNFGLFITHGGGPNNIKILEINKAGIPVLFQHHQSNKYMAFSASVAKSDSKGNYYMSGLFWNANQSILFLIKWNHNYSPNYARTFAHPDNNIRMHVSNFDISSDNTLSIFSGLSDAFIAKNYNLLFSKADSTGKLISTKVMDNTVANFITDLSTTIDTGLLLSYSLLSRSYIQKTDINGNSFCNNLLDTFLIPDTFKITVTNLTLPKRVAGFPVTDTVFALSSANQKENLICAERYYPIANLGADTLLCSGIDSFLLDAGPDTSGFTYLWSTGEKTSSIKVTESGTYKVYISNSICTDSDAVNIVFYDEAAGIQLQDTVICPYDSVFLSASDTDNIKYRWVTPAGDTVAGNSLYTSTPGLYKLMLEGTGTCIMVDSVEIDLHNLPTSHAGPDTTLCYNQTYTMQGAGGITYKWTPAVYLSADDIPDPVAKLPHTQQYHLIVSNQAGCTDTSAVLLQVRPPLQAAITASATAVCPGDSIKLTAAGKGGDSTSYSFSWPQFGEAAEKVHKPFYQSGWVKVVLEDGCSEPADDSIYIEVHPAPVAAFTTVPADTAFVSNSISFINQSSGAFSYLWHIGSTTSSAVFPNHIFQDTGTYHIMLIAYNQHFCADTAFGQIYVDDAFHVYIPNAFSPNANDVNEVWQLNGTGIKEYSFEIYNRWGELIFSSQKSSQSNWDGTYKGKAVPEGVYVYKIIVIDKTGKPHAFNGSVQVLR